MNKYIEEDPWQIIERGFDPNLHPISESLFSIGNGRMGQRANFEESYTGETLQGSYIAGVYYPDKTRVGWWKNGYPEYFAKVLNSVNWIGLTLRIDGETIDLAKNSLLSFNRSLDMRDGILCRTVRIALSSGKVATISSRRFYSLYNQNWAYLEYSVATDQAAEIEICSFLDFNVRNADANYDDDFWHNRHQEYTGDISYLSATTKKTDFQLAAAALTEVRVKDSLIALANIECREGFVSTQCIKNIPADVPLILTKYVAIHSSFYEPKEQLRHKTFESAAEAHTLGISAAMQHQRRIWSERWKLCDIEIQGDVAAQQGIRFNIFQLYQTYSGEDHRLNIGPKGFTGEKYGGSTYWDTEAYCLPFYMAIAPQKVAHSLLVYRHSHLQKAIENATKLGFGNGAALYPMVTMNGEECHNEWEITFEEIHRNGAIAYAIYDYIRFTGDQYYLASHGVEVLIGIARFWAQRASWSEDKNQYVILGVTGPNEYENNVNNNWYTNYMASWCLRYASESILWVRQNFSEEWSRIKTNIEWVDSETSQWNDIAVAMYFPRDNRQQIFLQQDGFLDKELLTVKDLKKADRPINQKWSWDRILRSVFIKQADVLQGMYFFEEEFSYEEHLRNFDFYEPRTVHESSLSPCVHAILAAKLGKTEKAYEMYLRTARLDLDNYNNDTEDGCHITSMAGTWLAVVKGFGGMRYDESGLSFAPFLPSQWTSYSFNILYRGHVLSVKTFEDKLKIMNNSDHPLTLTIYGQEVKLLPNNQHSIQRI